MLLLVPRLVPFVCTRRRSPPFSANKIFELTQLLKSAITAFEATDKTVRAECRAAVGRKMVHSAPSVVLDAVFEQLFSLAQQDAAVALQRLNADASTSNDSMESAQGVMLFLGCLHSMAETRLE